MVVGCSAEKPATSSTPPPVTPVITSSEVTGVGPANSVITLLPASGAPPMPTTPARIDQISKQFLPNVLIARVGQKVEFHNGEDMPHNVTVTRRISGTEVFNTSTEREQTYTHSFDRIGQYDVRCDIHEGMEATIIVASGPMTTVSGDDGRFSIPNVAFGSYKLSVTYAGQTIEKPLEVSGARTNVQITP